MTSRPNHRSAARGFSLIELLVSMGIGLVVTLAITVVMVNGERDKRSTTSVNDINQSGGYAAYVLDRQIRNAGSGFAQHWDAVGCRIKAENTSGVVLSNAASFPVPFGAWPKPVRLAPIIVAPGAAGGTGDMLMVMAGTGGFVETPQPVLPGVLASSMKLANTFGFRTGDLVLLSDTNVPAGCMVQQIGLFAASATTGGADQSLNFESRTPPPTPAINYHHAVIDGLDVTSFGASSYVAQIGNVNANLPQFSLIGVGANNTLYSDDLLPAGSLAGGLQAIADGVVELRALYGMAPTGSTVPVWTVPANPGTIDSATLRTIVAVRIGMILRTSLYEKAVVAPATVTLFGDLPVALRRTRTIASTSDDAHYRYRTVELTIPLPNVISAP